MDQSVLNNLIPLNELSTQLRQRILAHSPVLHFGSSSTIFRQGDRDNYTYYLLKGVVELHVNDVAVKEITAGKAATRYPLPQQQPRQATAFAVNDVDVLAVDRRLLENLLIIANRPRAAGGATQQDWLGIMLSSELFRRIPPTNIQSLLDTLESVQYRPGALVIRQGDPGDYFYIIQSGTCEVIRTVESGEEVKLAQLKPGDSFGEEALVTSSNRNATIRMTSEGTLARINCEDFVRLIRQPVLQSVSREEALELAANDEAILLDVRYPSEHTACGSAHQGRHPEPLQTLSGLLRHRQPQLRGGLHPQ
jgi:CRP-like cAMP-binding protein